MNQAEHREDMAQELLTQTRDILAGGEIDRNKLKLIEKTLSTLADNTELWGEEDFCSPSVDEKQNRFQIAQDDEFGLSLYLNVMRPGKKIPRHNHTTWACVSAVVGSEINTVHDRHDGNLESTRRYLEWELGLLDQLDEQKRTVLRPLIAASSILQS
jgi:predicted metal-dependent enzyme (double-stranded beta helix superfamily)